MSTLFTSGIHFYSIKKGGNSGDTNSMVGHTIIFDDGENDEC